MKYVIDIPDNTTWMMFNADMTEAKYISGNAYGFEFGKTTIEPYEDPETLCVGDEVACEENYGYVLVPDYGKNAIVILSEAYSSPQVVYKQDWRKTGNHNKEVERFVKLSAEAMERK